MIIIKPDAFERRIVGKILETFEHFGFRRIYSGRMTQEHCDIHYAAHIGQPYYGRLCEHMKSGLCLFVDLQGDWEAARSLAAMIRGRTEDPRNLIHASDSQEADERETNFWFRHYEE